MAITTLTGTQLVRNTWAAMPTAVDNDTTLGTKLKPLGPDHLLLIYYENEDSTNDQILVVKKGVGPMAATEDFATTVQESTKGVICIEAGRYMAADGYIYLHAYDVGGTTGTADIEYAFIQLPR